MSPRPTSPQVVMVQSPVHMQPPIWAQGTGRTIVHTPRVQPSSPHTYPISTSFSVTPNTPGHEIQQPFVPSSPVNTMPLTPNFVTQSMSVSPPGKCSCW